MPPRYAYWTIIVDNQPTAFRAAKLEEIMPTFNRLKEKHPSAVLMWFQNGKLWPNRLDAQEAMRLRGEKGREGERRREGGHQDRRSGQEERRSPVDRPRREDRKPWPRDDRGSTGGERKPWGDRKPAGRSFGSGDRKPFGKPGGDRKSFGKPGGDRKPWARDDRGPKGGDRKPWGDRRPVGRSFGSGDRKPHGDRRNPSGDGIVVGPSKLEWRPKGSSPNPQSPAPKPFKAKRQAPKPGSKNWRPGGNHEDPRQKYKDAKKAKWTRFKQNIRARHDQRRKKKDGDE